MGEGLAATRVVAATVLVNLGLVGIVGAWASMVWLRHAHSRWGITAQRRSWIALRVAVATTAVADGLLLWLQAAYLGDVPLPAAIGTLPSVLAATYVGHAWLGGAVGLALVVAAVSGRSTRQLTARLAGVLLGISVFVYCRAAVSHAGDYGMTSLQLVVESVHLWAISFWLGAVGIAGFVILRQPDAISANDRSDVGRWVRALSTGATGALVVIIATGVLNAWRSVGSVANLVGSAYGNTLLVKVAIVAMAVGLGALNRLRSMPRLLAALQYPDTALAPSQGRFVRVLRIEVVVLLAALVAAAFLSSSPLPPATTSHPQP